jgi:hypothetical protein
VSRLPLARHGVSYNFTSVINLVGIDTRCGAPQGREWQDFPCIRLRKF